MTAQSVFRTKRFLKKYDEVPQSEIEKVLVQGEHATVHYLEPDGDHEKLVFVRESGQWKAWLVLPKFKQS